MSFVNHKVLILNQTYEPLQVCTGRRAVILLFSGRAERVEDTDLVVRSPSTAIRLPSVIRLQRLVRRPLPSATISFNKKNILRRDGHTCQYCGRNGGERLTIDHVIPRSLGGRTVWENVVSACRGCNLRKGNRDPHGAGMRLLRRPVRPVSVVYLGILGHAQPQLGTWGKYLPRAVEDGPWPDPS
jgi:5-methylcytosine-specific restriction endonuclease McrA